MSGFQMATVLIPPLPEDVVPTVEDAPTSPAQSRLREVRGTWQCPNEGDGVILGLIVHHPEALAPISLEREFALQLA
jgi:hypothetical protein